MSTVSKIVQQAIAFGGHHHCGEHQSHGCGTGGCCQAARWGASVRLGYRLAFSLCFVAYLHGTALLFLLPLAAANFIISRRTAGLPYGCAAAFAAQFCA